MKAYLVEFSSVEDSKEAQKHIRSFDSKAGIFCVRKVKDELYEAETKSAENGKRIISGKDLLFSFVNRLFKSGFSRIARIKLSGYRLPPDMLKHVINFHVNSNNQYTRCSMEELYLPVLIEIIDENKFNELKKKKRKFLPDGSFNIKTDPESEKYWLSENERKFYQIDNFERYYPFPLTIAIELAPNCNLRCTKCPFHSNTHNRSVNIKKSDFMSFETYRKIVDEASSKRKGVTISPAVRGEPLLHPCLTEMIKYAKDKGCVVGFATNANLLTPETSKAIIDSGLDSICFSVDAIDEATYNVLQPGGNFKRVLENIEEFLKIKGKKGSPDASIIFIESEENSLQVDDFMNKWIKKLRSVTIQSEHDVSRAYKIYRRYFDIKERFPCFAYWVNLYIHWDGSVVPCGMDYDGSHVLGNINRNSIEEIWKGKAFMDLRNKQFGRKRDLSYCKACTSWSGISGISHAGDDVMETVYMAATAKINLDPAARHSPLSLISEKVKAMMGGR
ncbi:MAG: radical SAM protein [Firmicutes bacterium]|nr:radical SAM protein [Bacillota bacterium]